jgi:hypothetical protein
MLIGYQPFYCHLGDTSALKIKFGDRKIIAKYGYERVCNKSHGALRTFMQNNPIITKNCEDARIRSGKPCVAAGRLRSKVSFKNFSRWAFSR